MKAIRFLVILGVIAVLPADAQKAEPDETARLAEMDAYWTEVSRCVNEGDFDGYKATFHEDAVYVSGTNGEAYPISDALTRWKPDFTTTKSGKIKASVEFKFSTRLGDGTTAHETGIFHYTSVDADGVENSYYIKFEALLVKQGTWKAMMEYQKSEATEEDWNNLK